MNYYCIVPILAGDDVCKVFPSISFFATDWTVLNEIFKASGGSWDSLGDFVSGFTNISMGSASWLAFDGANNVRTEKIAMKFENRRCWIGI